ncbi:TPA-induced transmembrane protein [Pogona vitticeps]
MNGHVPLQDAEHIELQIGREDGEDTVTTSDEPLQPQVPSSVQEKGRLKSCSTIVCWKCKLWMVAVSIFFLIIFVIILILIFYPVVYIDEDEFWDPESIANGNRHNFSGMLKIHCAAPQLLLSDLKYDLLSEYLHKRLTDVYSNSPALGRYFISAEVNSISEENGTVSYHLSFSVPSDETEEFMKYRMSKNFLMNVLRQDIYDKEELDGAYISGCTNMTLDPTSISLKQLQADTAGG